MCSYCHIQDEDAEAEETTQQEVAELAWIPISGPRLGDRGLHTFPGWWSCQTLCVVGGGVGVKGDRVGRGGLQSGNTRVL